MLFHKILFPVDFSEPCQQVIPCVAAMQEAMCAQLVLLHSIELPRDWPPNNGISEWVDYDALRACDYERLKSFEAVHFGERYPDLVQETGDPASAILRCVQARNVDLVMMPTHGYGMFRRALIGSVTTKVLHDVPCAVWTAAHGHEISKPAYEHVLCAIDEPDRSGMLLRFAAELAGVFRADLSIVHAYPDFAGSAEERYERHIPKRAEESIHRALDSLQQAAGTSADVIVAGGEVNEVIAETAHRRAVDLVITGRGTFGGLLLSLRSHLYDIVRSSPCPVLVLNDQRELRAPAE